jgi:hypothetical protein
MTKEHNAKKMFQQTFTEQCDYQETQLLSKKLFYAKEETHE